MIVVVDVFVLLVASSSRIRADHIPLDGRVRVDVGQLVELGTPLLQVVVLLVTLRVDRAERAERAGYAALALIRVYHVLIVRRRLHIA